MSFSNRILWVIATRPEWVKVCYDKIYLSKEDAFAAYERFNPEHYHVYEVYIESATFEEVK